MTNFVSKEVINDQVKELKKIVDDLIIVSEDGVTAKAKPGVKTAQILYAVQEVEKITKTFNEMAARRKEYNKELDGICKKVDKAKETTKYFLDKYGENFYPSWYKKMLSL
jgi:NAD-dependent DNA ligase